MLLHQSGKLYLPNFNVSIDSSALQPIGAVSVACICFIVPSLGNPELTPERIESAEAKFRRFSLGKWSPTPGSFIFRLGLIDYTGFILLLAREYTLFCDRLLFGAYDYVPGYIVVTCLLLGIQWGGDQYPWSSSKVIGVRLYNNLNAILSLTHS